MKLHTGHQSGRDLLGVSRLPEAITSLTHAGVVSSEQPHKYASWARLRRVSAEQYT